MMERPTHLVITGPMGAGKTTAGRLVAERLGRHFLDSDFQLEEQFEASARRIAREESVDALHRIEAQSLRAALGTLDPMVVAAAASVGDLPAIEELIDDHFLVLLDGSLEVMAQRASTGDHRRSMPQDEYASLAARRRAHLASVIDLTVDVTRASPDVVADRIVTAFEARERAGST